MPTVEPQMLKGVLALLLLQLVEQQEDYGYSLVQRLRAAGLVDAAEGSVYPALARLEAKGLLLPRMVREGRGPGRRYYSPSPSGVEELARLHASWAAVSAAVRAVGDKDVAAGTAPAPTRGARG